MLYLSPRKSIKVLTFSGAGVLITDAGLTSASFFFWLEKNERQISVVSVTSITRGTSFPATNGKGSDPINWLIKGGKLSSA